MSLHFAIDPINNCAIFVLLAAASSTSSLPTMEQLKRKMSQLRMDSVDAQTKADEALEEKKQAMAKLDEVGTVRTKM